MDKQFWIDKWQANEIGFHAPSVQPLLLSCWPLVARRMGRVLVPLCGKSLDLHWLNQVGHDAVGVELSPLAAEAFFTEAELTPDCIRRERCTIYRHEGLEIINGDWFAITEDDVGPVDVVYDRAALVAMPADLREAYVAKLRDVSADVPILLITLRCPEAVKGPPFDVSEEEVLDLFPDRRVILVAQRGSDVKGCPVTEQAFAIF